MKGRESSQLHTGCVEAECRSIKGSNDKVVVYKFNQGTEAICKKGDKTAKLNGKGD